MEALFPGRKPPLEFLDTLAPRKVRYDKPIQHIKKQRQHFANKVCIAKALVFPVVMYGCESWAIKKAEELMLLNCGVGKDS